VVPAPSTTSAACHNVFGFLGLRPPESLIEDELFGTKGAFTGAISLVAAASKKPKAGPFFSTRWGPGMPCKPNFCACCRSAAWNAG